MNRPPIRRLTFHVAAPRDRSSLDNAHFVSRRTAAQDVRDKAATVKRLLATAYELHDGVGYLPRPLQAYVDDIIARAQWLYRALHGISRHCELRALHLVAPPRSLLRHTHQHRRVTEPATPATPAPTPATDDANAG